MENIQHGTQERTIKREKILLKQADDDNNSSRHTYTPPAEKSETKYDVHIYH